MSHPQATMPPAVAWHEAECGGYAADLSLWEELAGEASGPILELGAGAGRVALRLARAGFEVTALDRDPELLAELDRRAVAERLDVATVVADARELNLARRFALIAAPMQLAHLLDAAGRAQLLEGAARHLAPRGRIALSLLADERTVVAAGAPPFPDVLELDGWVYSSVPIEVRRLEGGLEVRRLRQVVSPSGELREEVDDTRLERVDSSRLEREAAGSGLRPQARRPIAATRDHVGSIVVVLERT